MGCVSSQSTKDRKQRTTKELNRDSLGNPLNDVDAAMRRDKKGQNEDVSKKNKELSKQIQKLRKQNQIKKKESKESIQQKEKQIKKLEEQKNREIQKLKKELEKEKQKQKENKARDSKYQPEKDMKQQKAVGLASLEDHKSMCQECFYKLPRYTATNPNMGQCMSCRGYGLSMDRFPYGANPSCDKALCFKKGWDKVKSLRLCTICGGKGGHQARGAVGLRRY